ncbi:MAG: gliding motility protein GldM [Tannerella sp.]|jgi:gliding motility-associated protein GldM|nr:gliding motility protein GldM [Tannerella sp.]
MAGISSNPNSPRQKMINLMYLVFIAMMALNVSSEVLDGFELVENSLQKTITNARHRNEIAWEELDFYYKTNPDRVGEWHTKGSEVKRQSDELFDYIQDLKVQIVKKTDGKDGDIHNIKHKEDLEAASRVMLAPVIGEGKILREKLEAYRSLMAEIVADTAKVTVIESVLNLRTPSKGGITAGNWETALFENMPVAAAITILTKLQNDVSYVEGEALAYILSGVDEGAYRINDVRAMVIPNSQIVMQGTPYQATIALVAVDTTQHPRVIVDGNELPESAQGVYTGSSAGIGEHKFSGEVQITGSDGSPRSYPFADSYFVTEQTATIAPVLMNVLYENIDNDIEVAIPGVPSGSVRATASVGTMTQKSGNVWTARPPSNATKLDITLSAVSGGRNLSMTREFKVRPLPPATPFITYKDAAGTTRKFTGGSIAKRYLVEANGIMAAIDDGILDIPFTVTGFELVFYDSMGNALPEVSQSGAFTERQKTMIRNLARGKRFYITNVRANDPGGKAQRLATIEVIVN